MKLVVTPNNLSNAFELIAAKADIILVGQKEFSDRMNYDCQIDDLKKLLEAKTKSQIWVNVNTFFFEQDLQGLEEYLKILNDLEVDRIVFNDYAVVQIVAEQNLNLILHYNPNTLITSYAQFDFYIENNFKSVSIANELFYPEVKIMADNKPDGFELMMQVQGFVFIMHSRWNLVTNFQNYVNDEQNEYTKGKQLFIKELNKVWSNIIIEDDHGTHMLSGYELSLIKFINQIKSLKIDYLLIDSYLNKEDNYTIDLLKIYQNLLSNDSLEPVCIFEDYSLKTKNKLSAGFFGGIKEIKHLEKN